MGLQGHTRQSSSVTAAGPAKAATMLSGSAPRAPGRAAPGARPGQQTAAAGLHRASCQPAPWSSASRAGPLSRPSKGCSAAASACALSAASAGRARPRKPLKSPTSSSQGTARSSQVRLPACAVGSSTRRSVKARRDCSRACTLACASSAAWACSASPATPFGRQQCRASVCQAQPSCSPCCWRARPRASRSALSVRRRVRVHPKA